MQQDQCKQPITNSASADTDKESSKHEDLPVIGWKDYQVVRRESMRHRKTK